MVVRQRRRGFGRVLGASAAFFIVYTIIHIGLNVTDQGTRNFFDAWNSTSRGNFWVEMSGPITVSVCSSLLIFVYGIFLLDGLDKLSAADPMSFVDAFMIFVIGQIFVQLAGHSEIAINNAILAHEDPPWYFDVISLFTYPVLFLSLLWLEGYERRVYRNLDAKFPGTFKHRQGGDLRLLTLFTIFVLLAKSGILWYLSASLKGEDENVKAALVLISLAFEMIIVGYVVVYHYRAEME